MNINEYWELLKAEQFYDECEEHHANYGSDRIKLNSNTSKLPLPDAMWASKYVLCFGNTNYIELINWSINIISCNICISERIEGNSNNKNLDDVSKLYC